MFGATPKITLLKVRRRDRGSSQWSFPHLIKNIFDYYNTFEDKMLKR